jgi:NhaP-type Na+/H+ or K+/H+ antiporter
MAMDFFYKAAGAVLAPFRYAQREIDDAKENLKEDAQEALSTVLKITVMVLCALFFLLFGSITAATAINDAMNSAWSGFAIVGGVYLVLAVGVYVWKQASDKKKHEHPYEHHATKSFKTQP